MKPMTEEAVLKKLTAFCAKAEHCTGEICEKLYRWQVPEEQRERIVSYLIEHRFIDDERYTRAFIADKIRFAKWGKRKIAQALYLKHIPREIIESLLDEVGTDDYEEELLPQLTRKWQTITAQNNYERGLKLIRWAMGRGYEWQTIKACMARMEEEVDEDEYPDDMS